jgi:hypothetical protein
MGRKRSLTKKKGVLPDTIVLIRKYGIHPIEKRPERCNVIHSVIERRTDMKDKETLHRKVQELVDCFATTDPLREMSMLKAEEGQEESPLKWLALAVLHGINAGAKEISVVKSADGTVRVLAEYWKAELPTPGPIIGERIFESLRRITHLEGDQGKTVLAMGVRDGSIDLRVEVEREKEGEKITLGFSRGSDGEEVREEKKQDRGQMEPKPQGGDMEYCRFAADAEHERAYREEEPCDDARAGDYKKRIETEAKKQ